MNREILRPNLVKKLALLSVGPLALAGVVCSGKKEPAPVMPTSTPTTETVSIQTQTVVVDKSVLNPIEASAERGAEKGAKEGVKEALATIQAVAPKPELVPTSEQQIARAGNLIRLQKILEREGFEAWAKAAGFSFDRFTTDPNNLQQLRQTVTDSKGNAVTVTNGLLANVKNLKIQWPAVAGMPFNQTVSDPNAVCIPGDPKEQSKLCTNVQDNGTTGTFGLYPDGRDNLDMVAAVKARN